MKAVMLCGGVVAAMSWFAGAVAWSAPAAVPLFPLGEAAALERVKSTDAQVERVRSGEGYVLRVRTGHLQPWPGVTLMAPPGGWDLEGKSWVSLRAHNLGTNAVTVYCRVDTPGADGRKNCVTGSAALAPGASGTVRVDLQRFVEDRLDGKLFGMRGYPRKPGTEFALGPGPISQILVFVSKPDRDHEFVLMDLQAAGTLTPPTAQVTDADPYFPCIDTFGQYRHRDWPGKLKSLEELRERARAEESEWSARPRPDDWDEWGGWKGGPALPATGFFRTAKHEGKWWLVDPAGHLFWSHGVDCVRMLDFTLVTERESWFEDFPGNQPEWASMGRDGMTALKGHYSGRKARGYSFAGANLMRKYGSGWAESASAGAHRRLASWGLNTIGNWSDHALRRLRRTPYVDSVGTFSARRIEGSEGYWGKFPDPYDASFRAALQSDMQARRGGAAVDPWCVGFFSDNEIAWGEEGSLAVAALQSPADQPAKVAMVAWLREKYGSITNLNAVWGSSHESWEALRLARTAPDRVKAREDLNRFYSRLAEAYFHTAREVIKETAPQHLYLGCRFAWVNALAAAAAAKYCDVVSYNLYQRSVADFRFNGGGDVPLLIGEFHFGALDRGLFHTGLVPTANQVDRAETYRGYVQGALRHPQFVGCHWFQYQDEPTTGRAYDEENYQIGLVDVTDTPYPETIEAVRAVGYRLYRERAGR